MMGSNWNEDILKNLCIGIFSGGTPLTTKKEYWDGDIHWLSSGETRSRYIVKTEKTITQAGVDNSSTRKALTGDIVVASAGQGLTRGQVSFCLIDTYINQSLIAIRTKVENISPLFLYYSLLSRYEELRSVSDASSTRGSLTCRIIESLPLRYPAYESQIIIAAILSAYDDLIENNLRRIKILEEMAQNLYREWFVNFRFPGHEKARYVDSPLGRIPEGWAVVPMKSVANVVDCLHSKKPDADDEGSGILIQLFNIENGGKLNFSKKYLISEDDYVKWTKRIELSEGDCIITNVGRIAAVAQMPKGKKAALGRNMTGLSPINGKITPTYLIEYLLSPHMASEVRKKSDSGVIMDSLNVRSIYLLSVPIPESSLMDDFECLARPIRQSIENLVEKNYFLRQTRDLLLPNLISGEVDVSELDINVPEEVSA